MRWSAPGSLLLAGEYRITEDGGRGVAIAGGAKAVLDYKYARDWRIRAIPADLLPSPWVPGMEGLAGAVWDLLSEFGMGTERGCEAMLDSRDFFDSAGVKLGLGSSAAAAILFSCVMGGETRLSPIIRLALGAHRAWQGGRGSGYDVLCSAHGGLGIFTGGEQPLWEGLECPEGLEFRIFQGKSAVSSSEAVGVYTVWREENVSAWRSWRRLYDRELEGFLEALCGEDDWGVLEALRALGALGVELGEAIGISAVPRLKGIRSGDLISGSRKGVVLKSVGAGNETVLAVSLPGELGEADLAGFEGVQRRIYPVAEGLLHD